MANFPLSVSANGRYLVDASGVPFRIQADSSWLLGISATVSDMDTYLDNRVSKHFNSIEMLTFAPSGFPESTGTPANAIGEQPFNTPNDFSTPNNDYFDYLELAVQKCQSRGLLVQFFYMYLGYMGGGEGWWSVVQQSQNTQAVCYSLGLYLGNRFKDYDNIIWMAMGDYSPPTGEGQNRLHKILEGIRAAGATQICGAESSPPDTIPTQVAGYTAGPTISSDLQLNSYYCDGPGTNGHTYLTANDSWALTPTLPGYGVEPYYEFAAFIGSLDSAPWSLRRYMYWSILGGGTAGMNFGVMGLYAFVTDWEDLLDTDGAFDRMRSFLFFSRIQWWRMAPSGVASGFYGRNIIVSGGGSGDSFVAASGTTTGNCVIAYVPSTGTTGTTFSVDLRGLAGTSKAYWWNPTTDVYTYIGTFSNSLSSQSFTTPGNNGTGRNDWMLLAITEDQPPLIFLGMMMTN